MLDDLHIDAGGGKPERQQHIHNEHAHKLHSHTRGAHRGRQAQKSERRGGRERYFCVSTHPLDENGNIIEKLTFVLEWHTNVLRDSREW